MVGKHADARTAESVGIVRHERRGINAEHAGDAPDEGAHVDGLGQLIKAFRFDGLELLNRQTGARSHIAERNALLLADSAKHVAEAFFGRGGH